MTEHLGVPRGAKVNWLVMDKFSGASAEAKLDSLTIPPEPEKYGEALEYVLELMELSDEDIDERFSERYWAVFQQMKIDAASREAIYFFNVPSAFPDHVFWAKSLLWTVEQAVALSMNRNPFVVSSETLEANGLTESRFGQEYHARRYLVEQSIYAGRLVEPISPEAFIDWLQRMRLSHPADMVTAAEETGHILTDWEDEYDALIEHYEALEAEAEATKFSLQKLEAEYAHKLQAMYRTVSDQAQEIKSLKDELAEIQSKPALEDRPTAALLKIVIAIAIKKFGYRPGEKRNKATTNIVNAVTDIPGMQITDDTVRKYLRLAETVLPKIPDSGSQ